MQCGWAVDSEAQSLVESIGDMKGAQVTVM